MWEYWQHREGSRSLWAEARRQTDQAYLDQLDTLAEIRDTTESAYRAWLPDRLRAYT